MSITLLVAALGLTAPAIHDKPAPPGETTESATATLTPATAQDEAVDEGPVWTGSIVGGYTHTDGNTKIDKANINGNAKRETEKDRWSFKAWWNYGKEDGDQTEKNAGTTLQYDYFIRERLYVLGTLGAETDDESDLDLRWYAGPGVGYDFVKKENVSLSADASIVYFKEKFDGDTNQDYVALRAAYHYGNQLTETTRFEQDAGVFPSLEDKEDIYCKLDTRLKVSLTESMFGQAQWVFDYDNTPASGNDRVDQRFVLGVGWSF